MSARPDPEAAGRAAGDAAGPLPPDLVLRVLDIVDTPDRQQDTDAA